MTMDNIRNGTVIPPNAKVLITGAGGFVGRHLCEKMLHQGWKVRAAVRAPCPLPLGVEIAAVGTIDGETDWTDVLSGVDAIIHLAARAHVMRETKADSMAIFRAVNVTATEHLAHAAVKAGIRRFVFISTVKVNGETTPNLPFSESMPVDPQDAYGLSKWEAEQHLRSISDGTGMELVILRPPLVYGPGVRANFLRLLSIANSGLPLPLESVKNRRSLIYVGNLVSAIQACLEHPSASGQTFLVSDGEDMSTAELIRRIGKALGRPVRLWPMPIGILQTLGGLLGRSAEAERLFDSLVIDNSKIRQLLDWNPPFTVDMGLADTAEWFLKL